MAFNYAVKLGYRRDIAKNGISILKILAEKIWF